MIRIVDILKKAGEWDIPEAETAPVAAKPPVPEAPKALKIEEQRQAELQRQERERAKTELFSEIIGLLKEGTPAADKLLVLALGKIVEAQLAGNRDLLKGLCRVPEDKRYIHAVAISLHAVKLGIDAGYDRGKLVGLAAAAINFDLRQISPESGEDRSIIDLAEIYEQTTH